MVVESVAKGGCNELQSKLKLLSVDSRTEESFHKKKKAFRPQLGRTEGEDVAEDVAATGPELDVSR